MADDTRDQRPEAVDAALGGMKLEEGESPYGGLDDANGKYEDFPTPGGARASRSTTPAVQKSGTPSPIKKQSASQTPKSEDEEGMEVVGGDIVLTTEPGKVPKLQRKPTQKIRSRTPPLFTDTADSTEEAVSVFQVIKDCIYGSKAMGYSEHDALDCDCSEEWRGGKNHACGEDSDCINRATKMECVDGNCNCGVGCQNQRFQRRQYANVSVIKTEKKGYGLRANVDLYSGDFIFEYIGEVINEPTFRRRTIQYDEEGIKHFYFMSLTKHEFVDATKKGNLGRFCNHSCNPNCYVDKWVVGDKLRMGIFAERHIKAGEELVFNYNVDRYGADPQPCYCGEHNCSGYIGGKTQTERATKLSHATIEALGIDDGDGWDTAVAKKPRKKKTGEDDEEYVSNVQPKGLDEDGVRKVMATLMQCKEKWIAVKLLSRLQNCDDDKVRNRVVQMHGYQILRTTITTWKDDNNVILQVLDILYKFPRLTKNKIQDSKIEATVETLKTSEHEDVALEASRLLQEWNRLEVAYRIPRKKFDPNAAPVFERRNTDRAEETRKSPTPTTLAAPTGPRNHVPQRSASFNPRPPVRRNFNALPPGWFTALDQNNNTYYYSKAGQTTWVKPTLAAVEPPPPPKIIPKSVQTQKALQDIIDSITKPEPSSQTPKSAPTTDSTPVEKKAPTEKWRSLSQEKQMKLYENTLFPHIKHVMQKFTKQLSKEDLKKFAKEVGKMLVASDFKHKRVEDPTKISEKQEKKVKKYVRDFFERVVEKRKEIDKQKKEREARKLANGTSKKAAEVEREKVVETPMETPDTSYDTMDLTPDTPLEVEPSPNSSSIPPTPALSDLKRKRYEAETPGGEINDDTDSNNSNKRHKETSTTPPPPPPPPPADLPLPILDAETETMEVDGDAEPREETEEEKELRRQEEDLMRENEEALLMDMDGSLGVVEQMAEANGVSTALHPVPGPVPIVENGNGHGKEEGLGIRIGDEVEEMGMGMGMETDGDEEKRLRR